MDINSPLPSLISNLYQENKNLGSDLATEQAGDADSTTVRTSSTVSSDSLSLSIRSQKLSAISKEFFNGPIASNNVAALSQSLYENGFINNNDLQSLGGEQAEQSTIAQSKHFINSFMFEASKQGDEKTISMLEPIALAIDNMDSASTSSQRQNEVVALDNANQVLAHLKEIGADTSLISEFENVVDVLSTLDTLRQNDQVNQGVAEYEAIQNEYGDLFTEPEDT
jgi:hypothetical protein